ncbi:MAG: helix-turn-helix domain-containing protein [Steroidobacteraceae bacterium]
MFSDLGFSKAEAVALQARVTLAVEIERFIEKNGLTQAKAAAVFGVPQPTISKIVRGDLSRLSIEYLLKMLARVGIPVQLVAGTRKPVRRSVAA